MIDFNLEWSNVLGNEMIWGMFFSRFFKFYLKHYSSVRKSLWMPCWYLILDKYLKFLYGDHLLLTAPSVSTAFFEYCVWNIKLNAFYFNNKMYLKFLFLKKNSGWMNQDVPFLKCRDNFWRKSEITLVNFFRSNNNGTVFLSTTLHYFWHAFTKPRSVLSPGCRIFSQGGHFLEKLEKILNKMLVEATGGK